MARLPGLHPHARRLELVEDAFRTLPDRYLGAHPGFDVTYHVRLGDVGRTWEVRCTEHTARVRRGHLVGKLHAAHAAAVRSVVDLVVDVGDVRHERHVVPLVLEEALEQ